VRRYVRWSWKFLYHSVKHSLLQRHAKFYGNCKQLWKLQGKKQFAYFFQTRCIGYVDLVAVYHILFFFATAASRGWVAFRLNITIHSLLCSKRHIYSVLCERRQKRQTKLMTETPLLLFFYSRRTLLQMPSINHCQLQLEMSLSKSSPVKLVYSQNPQESQKCVHVQSDFRNQFKYHLKKISSRCRPTDEIQMMTSRFILTNNSRRLAVYK